MNIPIVNISIAKSTLRPISIVLIFVPIILKSWLGQPAMGILVFLFLLFSLYCLFFMVRYNVIGWIKFDYEEIVIDFPNEKSDTILSENIEININYRGYEWEPLNHWSIVSIHSNPLAFNEGIGQLCIKNKEEKKSFRVLLKNKETINELTKLKNEYEKRKIKLNIIKDN